MPENTKSLLQKAWFVWLLVGLITLLGTYFRFAGIDRVGIPGDELEIWHMCTQATSVSEIMRGDVKRSMMNFLPGCAEYVQNTFSMEVNSLSLRLPGLAMGVLSIVIVFLLGRLLFGSAGGIMAAALFALNPVHIQSCREVYPYVIGMAGSALMIWAVLMLAFGFREAQAPRIMVYPVFLLGLFLMMQSSVAAWPLGLLLALMGLVLTFGMLWRPPRRFIPAVLLLLLTAIGVIPKLWPYIVQHLAKGTVRHGRAGSYSSLELFDPIGLKFLTNFAWGHTPLRFGFTMVVLAGVLMLLWINRRSWIHWVLPGILLIGFFATMISRYMSGNPFFTRFLTPILPAYLLLLAGALVLPVLHHERIPLRSHGARLLVAWLPFAVAMALLLRPAHLSATMTGRPAPYRQIVDWADSHLPPGTPILCDRYFDAWNEFKANSPTGVIFTASIPNEPVERYEQENWRGSAMSFFQNNPDAAFYETKLYWKKIGPWDWPHQFFAQKQAFIDKSFMELGRLGLAYRTIPSSYPREWLDKTIYFNTPEDLVRRAKAGGQSAFVLFGQHWQYLKARDFSDWRVMRDRTTIVIYNVTNRPIDVRLRIVGVAPQQAKTVRAGAHTMTFPAGRLVDMGAGTVTLQSGANVITLTDPAWGSKQVPLLVNRLEIDLAETDVSQK